jgi:hypothetical protein
MALNLYEPLNVLSSMKQQIRKISYDYLFYVLELEHSRIETLSKRRHTQTTTLLP